MNAFGFILFQKPKNVGHAIAQWMKKGMRRISFEMCAKIRLIMAIQFKTEQEKV